MSNQAASGSTVDGTRFELSPRDKAATTRSFSSKAGMVSQVETTAPVATIERSLPSPQYLNAPPPVHIHSPDRSQPKDEGEHNRSRAGVIPSNSKAIKRPTSRSSFTSFLGGAGRGLGLRTTPSSPLLKLATKSSRLTSNEPPSGQNTSHGISHSASMQGIRIAGLSSTTQPTIGNSALFHPGTEHRSAKSRPPPSPNPLQNPLETVRYDTDADGTSNRTWDEQTILQVPSRPQSRFSFRPDQLALVETSQSQDVAQYSPSTPTSPDDGSDRDWNLRTHWANWQSQEESWCDEHKVLAKAIVLYDWDGVIPSRSTRGFPSKEGCLVEICNISNKAWYQVHHQGKCEYLPSEYVQITEFSDDASRELFEKYHEPSNAAVNMQDSPTPSAPPAPKPKPNIWESVFYYSIWKKMTRRFPRKEPAGEANELPPVAEKRKERPDVPPAPFDREPHDFEQKKNRVVISMKSRPFATGVAIAFHVTLIPAPQWRFTTFRFDAELPSGQVIAGIYPQRVIGPSTSVHHNDARKQELAIKAKGGYMGSGLELGQTRGRSQEVEYMQKTRVAIVGGGINSGKATWNATEDVASQVGLENRFELTILVPTAKPPPQLKCYYAAKIGKSRQIFTSTQAVDKFENRCEFSFTS